LAELQQLTSIDLGSCEQITDAGLKAVVKLKQLTTLGLRGTQITGVGIKELATLQKLTALNLAQCNRLTDKGLKEVAKLQQLTYLFCPVAFKSPARA